MNRHQILQQWNLTDERLKEICQTCLLNETKDNYSDSEWLRLEQYKRVIFEGTEEHKELFEESKQKLDEQELDEQFESIISEIESLASGGENQDDKKPRKKMMTLFKDAEKEHNVTISLITGARLLEVAGLAEKDQYTASEYEKFLETCRLHYQEGQTLEQLIESNGVRGKGNASGLKEQIGQLRGQEAIQQVIDNNVRFAAQFEEEVNYYALQTIANMIDSGEFKKMAQATRAQVLSGNGGMNALPGSNSEVIDAKVVNED